MTDEEAKSALAGQQSAQTVKEMEERILSSIRAHGMETAAALEPQKNVITAAERMGGPPFELILQFFDYAHLPPHMGVVSQPFCELAYRIVRELPRNAERTVALRKLLEAKDAAVRAVISKP